MSRSLAPVAFLVSLLVTFPLAAQDTVPIPGTTATITLPRGCELVGMGRISCGTERIDVGGSALGYDELLATYRASGRGVTELPLRPRAFITPLRGGRMLLIRDGVDERLLLLGTTTHPRFDAGAAYGRILMATSTPSRGALVSGFERLPRDRIPYATVYWYDGSLTFTSGAIDTADAVGATGFFRAISNTTMVELCDNRAIIGHLPSTLVLQHRRQVSELVAMCEEAFVVTLPGERRLLAAQFGYVFEGGHAYSLTMSYGLADAESPFTCLEGFEHFALPSLSSVLGIDHAHDEPRARAARTARR